MYVLIQHGRRLSAQRQEALVMPISRRRERLEFCCPHTPASSARFPPGEGYCRIPQEAQFPVER